MAISDRLTKLTTDITNAYTSIENKLPKILPEGYTQVEYIESTGTQYIDTGVKGNSEIKIDIIFEITNTKETQFFFGSRQSVSAQAFCFLSVSGANNSWSFRSDFNNNFGIIQTKKISDMTGYPLFHVIKNKNITTIENNEFENSISYGNFSSNYNIYIFTVNNNNNTSNFSYMKLYSCKMWNNSGNLVRDFIPCYRNSDNVIGLYDTVNDVFYTNQGTGTFLKGYDTAIGMDKNTNNLSTAIDSIEVIEQATAEGESLSLANTKAMPYSNYVINGKSEQNGTPSPSNPSEIYSVGEVVLPSEYQQVEYITSDGNSYIDTNLQITGDFEIDLEFIKNQSLSGEQPIISIWTPQYNYWNLFIRADNCLEWYVNGHYLAQYVALTQGEKNQIKLKRDGNSFIFSQNGAKTKFSYSTDNNTATLKLFKRGDLVNNSYVSIGKVTIKKNNILVKKLIPCYKISDNTIGMYDIINDVFISNSGTGNFTKGNFYIHSKDIITIKQRGTTESNNFIIQTEPLRSLPNGVKDTIEAEQHRKIGRQTGTLTETTTITLSDAKTNGAYMCNIKPSGTLTGKTIELEAGDYEIIYELATEVIEPFTQQQATTYLDIIKTGSYEGTTNIYTDEDVKPTIGVEYYKKG